MISKMITKQFLKGSTLFLLLLGICCLFTLETKAQEYNIWSPQMRIPVYEDETDQPPFLIADQNRTVHAFNSQPLELDNVDSPEGIFYRQWSPDRGWSFPNDILIDGEGHDLRLQDIYLDHTGTIHLLLQIEGDLYHAKAPLVYAGQASAWPAPTLVGEQAVPSGPGLHYMAAIAGDANGNLTVIYSGKRDGNGIYTIQSTDNGDTWSEPEILSPSYDAALLPALPRLLADRTGKIHAVWNIFDGDGTGTSGHYARFDPETQSWSEPIEIDEGNIGLGIKDLSLYEYDDDLFVTYYQGRTNGNWWRRSSDGGLTWSEPARISSKHRGTNGPTSLVTDSDNGLHLFFGERIDEDNHGMWHSIWDGGQWSEPTAVVRGPFVKDVIGGIGFDPMAARAVIANGNTVLVSWGTDGQGSANGAWYSYAILDTPELQQIPLQLPPATATTAATSFPALLSLASSEATPTRPVLTIDDSNAPARADENPGTAIIIGLVPVTLFILIFITARHLLFFSR